MLKKLILRSSLVTWKVSSRCWRASIKKLRIWKRSKGPLKPARLLKISYMVIKRSGGQTKVNWFMLILWLSLGSEGMKRQFYFVSCQHAISRSPNPVLKPWPALLHWTRSTMIAMKIQYWVNAKTLRCGNSRNLATSSKRLKLTQLTRKLSWTTATDLMLQRMLDHFYAWQRHSGTTPCTVVLTWV